MLMIPLYLVFFACLLLGKSINHYTILIVSVSELTGHILGYFANICFSKSSAPLNLSPNWHRDPLRRSAEKLGDFLSLTDRCSSIVVPSSVVSISNKKSVLLLAILIFLPFFLFLLFYVQAWRTNIDIRTNKHCAQYIVFNKIILTILLETLLMTASHTGLASVVCFLRKYVFNIFTNYFHDC